MATAQEMLTAVETAIYARLNGGAVQQYSIGGRNIQYAQLSELYRLRDRFKREVNAANGNNTRTYASFKRPI